MNVRVTGQTQTNSAVAYLRQNAAGLAKYQDQVSSGLRVKLPSDDPAQYPALARARAAGERLGAYAGTLAAANTDLNAGVGALQEATSVLTRAKQIAVEGADAGTDQQGATALATEVDGLIARMLSAANTEQDGAYLFGGTATGSPPFAADAAGNPTTITYNGTADRGRGLIGPGQTVDTKYAGAAVFQRPGADVFQTLIGLRDDLRNPGAGGKSQAINARLGAIDAALDAVGDTTAEQASHLAGLDALQGRMTDLKLTADTRAGEIEGTDYFDAVVRMRAQENALQATMAVSAKLLQPSLLDFIR